MGDEQKVEEEKEKPYYYHVLEESWATLLSILGLFIPVPLEKADTKGLHLFVYNGWAYNYTISIGKYIAFGWIMIVMIVIALRF